MKIQLDEHIHVTRSAAEVYRYLLDFSTCEQWDPGVYRAAKRTPGAPGIGTVFDVTLAFAGRRVPMVYELRSLTPDREIELAGAGRGFAATDTISLHAEGDSTRIVYRSQICFEGRVSARLAGLFKPWFGRMARHAMAGLRRALMPPRQPPVLGWKQRIADHAVLPALPGFTERGYLAMPDKGLSEFMDGRTAVVTGATGGIGLAAACKLARLGAHVVLVGRSGTRLAAARAAVREFAGCGDAQITEIAADLSLLRHVRAAADEIAQAAGGVDVLVNNAGALFGERAVTDEGFERTLAINLLAPFLLTETLMPQLEHAGGRVINVASGGMYAQGVAADDLDFDEQPFDGTKVYAKTKRGLVAVTEHWATAYLAPGVTFNSMHPGWVATPGVADALPAFNRALGRWLRDARMGADTIVWLASAAAVAQVSGQFWFDRRPHPTAVLPGTRVDAAARTALVARLQQAVGR